ncbi:MAG: HAMP domain-containing histidine kinase [Planctomycetes bacterium]|nr:HAMP domain-containing histidine kinase [Planctomycetota bacterium]
MHLVRDTLLLLMSGAAAAAQETRIALEAVPLALEPSSACTAMVETADDRLWFAFLDRLVWHDGTDLGSVDFLRRDDAVEARGIRKLVARADGSLLIACTSGLWRLAAGSTQAVPLPLGERREVAAFAATDDGRAWLLGAGQLHVVHGDDRVVPAAGPGGTLLADLAADGTSVWAWSDTALFRGTWREAGPEWHLVGSHEGIVVATAHAGELTAVDQHGLVRIASDGATTRLHSDDGWSRARGILRGRDGFWLHSHEALWHVPFAAGEAQMVELMHHERFLPPPLQVVYEDRQGLLWTGNRTAIRRSVRRPGIDNATFASPLRDDGVSAMAEVGDTVWFGTDKGTLLRRAAHGWQRVPAPWSDQVPSGTSCVVAMTVANDGILYVAARRAGVFRRNGEHWEPWLEPTENVRTLVAAPDGGPWCAHSDVLERSSDEGGTTQLRIARSDRPAVISDAMALDDGSLLATCFRSRQGLQRLCPPGVQAKPFAMDWDGESVQRVLPGEAGTAWVATLTGLWRVDLAAQTRARVLTTNTSQWLRNLVPDGPERFWTTSMHELQHVAGSAAGSRWLGAEGGSHPRPFMQRSALMRRNGEVWFGTLGGYCRVTQTADAVFGFEMPRIHVAIEIGGHRSPPVAQGALHATAFVDSGPIQLLPNLIDRSPAQPPGWRVGLRGKAGLVAVPEDATFADLPPDTYTALLLLRRPWGEEHEVVLGTVEVRQHPATWPWWVAAALLVGGLLVSGWRTLQRNSLRARRCLHLERALAAGWPRPKEILDIAHVAIAATETLVRDGRAGHATVWLVRTGDGERLPVADFGYPLTNAAELARRCLASGHCLHDHVFWLADGERRTACVQIRGATLANVEILLHGVACVDDAAMQALETACAPVVAAIDQQVWLDRLEHEFVDRTSTLEADAHDLRGALTTLRMTAFTLGQASPDVPAATLHADAQRIGRSCEHILAALDSMLRQVTAAQPATLVPTDPARVLRSRVEQHQAAAKAKDLRLEIVDAQTGATARLDEFLFTRVVDNVLGNAIKYSPPGGAVRIRCELQATEYLIHFDDEGPGIPSGQSEAVFLPGNIGRNRPTGGESQTGLGLWIARQSMRAMQGGIWIENRDGKGTRVSLWLPRERAE